MVCPGVNEVADVVIWYGGGEFCAVASPWSGSIVEQTESGAPPGYPLTQ